MVHAHLFQMENYKNYLRKLFSNIDIYGLNIAAFQSSQGLIHSVNHSRNG